MVSLLTVFAAGVLTSAPNIAFDYKSGQGLFVTVDGVAVVQGSFFQYYEAGWTAGYYTSNSSEQKVVRRPNGDLAVSYASADGRATGSQVIARTSGGLQVRCEFLWSGEKPVKIEHTIGMLWASLLASGTVSVGNDLPRSLAQAPQAALRLDKRVVGPLSDAFLFDTPLTKISVRASRQDVQLIDGRNYDGDWSYERDLFWLGFPEIDIKPNEPVRVEVDLTFSPRVSGQTSSSGTKKLAARRSNSAQKPPVGPFDVLPKPKSINIGEGFVTLSDLAPPSSAAGKREASATFLPAVARRWVGGDQPLAGKARFLTAIGDRSVKPEGYRIKVTKAGVELKARDEAGLRYGMGTLAQLVRARNGELVLPVVEVSDWPSVEWRGAHFFVGPTTRGFQQRFLNRVLLPMRLNKVVLQCERTEWNSLPGIKTVLTTSRDDLKSLFDDYRSRGVEPIPMIQSFGHMEWLFVNDQNRDLVYNPSAPYAVDPRKPRTRKMLEDLWDEAIDLLKPKTVHFGLDEVDMIGFDKNPKLVTELWSMHIPWLGELAKKHGVSMMLWGDKGLAPGEAPDAALGDTKQDAKARRDAIPKGSLIGDWHYTNNPDKRVYTSLDLWKREGQLPIASSWFRPNNIYGQTHAAIEAGAGVLQTLWAGYTTTEDAMVNAFSQFSAFILAGEYAWSGRPELPANLPYDPEEMLYKLFYSPPSPVKPVKGTQLILGKSTKQLAIGDVAFALFDPISLQFALTAEGVKYPTQQTLEAVATGREIALALDVQTKLDNGHEVGTVTLTMQNGSTIKKTLKYGHHVRALADKSGTYFAARSSGLSAVRIPLGEVPGRIKSLQIEVPNGAAGLRLHGVTVW